MYRYRMQVRMKCKYSFEAAETMKKMQMQQVQAIQAKDALEGGDATYGLEVSYVLLAHKIHQPWNEAPKHKGGEICTATASGN
ncbi:hypothetical protein N7520_010454 [Penicillium odoratum]|uniref:uncharacterized protein n=1 Tax=Penicillium odoratum TaxID=1167516 RepID=UPI0025488301|nr:uncharacterized protein N7520_010454 [Penicillium odoratum]KAJ5745272.1 hypothetical protein N7520_010454 [Penicillium odoratum]